MTAETSAVVSTEDAGNKTIIDKEQENEKQPHTTIEDVVTDNDTTTDAAEVTAKESKLSGEAENQENESQPLADNKSVDNTNTEIDLVKENTVCEDSKTPTKRVDKKESPMGLSTESEEKINEKIVPQDVEDDGNKVLENAEKPATEIKEAAKDDNGTIEVTETENTAGCDAQPAVDKTDSRESSEVENKGENLAEEEGKKSTEDNTEMDKQDTMQESADAVKSQTQSVSGETHEAKGQCGVVDAANALKDASEANHFPNNTEETMAENLLEAKTESVVQNEVRKEKENTTKDNSEVAGEMSPREDNISTEATSNKNSGEDSTKTELIQEKDDGGNVGTAKATETSEDVSEKKQDTKSSEVETQRDDATQDNGASGQEQVEKQLSESKEQEIAEQTKLENISSESPENEDKDKGKIELETTTDVQTNEAVEEIVSEKTVVVTETTTEVADAEITTEEANPSLNKTVKDVEKSDRVEHQEIGQTESKDQENTEQTKQKNNGSESSEDGNKEKNVEIQTTTEVQNSVVTQENSQNQKENPANESIDAISNDATTVITKTDHEPAESNADENTTTDTDMGAVNETTSVVNEGVDEVTSDKTVDGDETKTEVVGADNTKEDNSPSLSETVANVEKSDQVEHQDNGKTESKDQENREQTKQENTSSESSKDGNKEKKIELETTTEVQDSTITEENDASPNLNEAFADFDKSDQVKDKDSAVNETVKGATTNENVIPQSKVNNEKSSSDAEGGSDQDSSLLQNKVKESENKQEEIVQDKPIENIETTDDNAEQTNVPQVNQKTTAPVATTIQDDKSPTEDDVKTNEDVAAYGGTSEVKEVISSTEDDVKTNEDVAAEGDTSEVKEVEIKDKIEEPAEEPEMTSDQIDDKTTSDYSDKTAKDETPSNIVGETLENKDQTSHEEGSFESKPETTEAAVESVTVDPDKTDEISSGKEGEIVKNMEQTNHKEESVECKPKSTEAAPESSQDLEKNANQEKSDEPETARGSVDQDDVVQTTPQSSSDENQIIESKEQSGDTKTSVDQVSDKTTVENQYLTACKDEEFKTKETLNRENGDKETATERRDIENGECSATQSTDKRDDNQETKEEIQIGPQSKLKSSDHEVAAESKTEKDNEEQEKDVPLFTEGKDLDAETTVNIIQATSEQETIKESYDSDSDNKTTVTMEKSSTVTVEDADQNTVSVSGPQSNDKDGMSTLSLVSGY